MRLFKINGSVGSMCRITKRMSCSKNDMVAFFV